MDASKGMARDRARVSSPDRKGDATRSDSTKIAISVFGSALTVAVALAALILTSAHYTRRQFHDQNEQTRRHFAEQNELMRRHFTEQIELVRRHSDSQFEQVREDLREVREDVREIRGDLEEVRADVRMLAERQEKVEGLLLAVHWTGAGAPSLAGSANLPPSRPEDPPAE